MKKFTLVFLVGIMAIISCDNSDSPSNTTVEDDYNRKAMLTNWADNIILPGIEDLVNKAESMKDAANAFSADPTMANLQSLRAEWLSANLAWQRVPMFLYRKGDEIGWRQFMNIYPTDVEKLEKNAEEGGYNLELNNTMAQQGFPAMDYMLHGLGGLGASDDEILAHYTTNDHETGYRNYLVDLATRIYSMSNTVYTDWTDNGFRDEFVNNDGSNSNASVDRLVNDFVFAYEKDIRANKVGIPAGVWADPLEDRVEAYYRQDVSKMLLLEALDASQDFFNGDHFGSDTQSGECFKTYLDYLNATKNGTLLSKLINDQYDKARTEINAKLGDNFSEEVANSNNDMLDVYNQLQLNAVLIKTDMYQALGVARDFVDSDGD